MKIVYFGCLLAMTALLGTHPAQGAPVHPPKLTVESLFGEVIVGLDDELTEQGWELQGAQGLIEWPQGEPAEKAAGLGQVAHQHVWIPICSLTSRPVRLTEEQESLDFFRGVPEPPAGVPRDGSMIGFKYLFYPNAVVDSAQLPGGGGEPLAFFLVKPVPEDLTEADVAPPLSGEAEAEQTLKQRLGYDDYHSARALAGNGRLEGALSLLEAASDTGYCQAQFLQGAVEGLREPPGSPERSRNLYQLAADQGLAEAQVAYGRMLLLGEGGPVDLVGALEYFGRAAARGLAEAQRLVYALEIEGPA
jgi:hypothetical protein